MKRFQLLFAAALLAALAGCPTIADDIDNPLPESDGGGCAAPCGTRCCGAGQVCNTGSMECESCTASCENKRCGDDGCNGSCGSCDPGFTCVDFECVPGSSPDAGEGQDAGEDQDAGTPGMSVAEFCERFVDAQLARYSECMSGPIESWEASPYLQKTCDDMTTAVASGRAVFTASLAPACLSWYQSSTCDEAIAYPQGNPCFDVVAGVVQDGGECFTTMDCASRWCESSPAACPGLCRARVAVGHSCSPSDVCEYGAICAAGTCKQLGQEGDPCGGPEGVVCAYPRLYCEGSTAEVAGTCRPKLTSGTCNQADACAYSYTCQGFSYYPQTPGTCVPLKTVGEGCTPGGRECELNSYCDPAGFCALYSSEGGPCGIFGTEYAGCLDSWCQVDGSYQGSCVPYRQAGDSCQQSEWAPCGDGVCDPTALECLPACHEP